MIEFFTMETRKIVSLHFTIFTFLFRSIIQCTDLRKISNIEGRDFNEAT